VHSERASAFGDLSPCRPLTGFLHGAHVGFRSLDPFGFVPLDATSRRRAFVQVVDVRVHALITVSFDLSVPLYRYSVVGLFFGFVRHLLNVEKSVV